MQFLEAVFDDSLKYPNFFNGRILTATDLQDEQRANLRRSRYLGQAAGEGVVYGLSVSRAGGGSALTISRGLAVNRNGDALYLPGETTTVELVIEERLVAGGDSPFVVCDLAGASTLTGVIPTGFHLLAITGASRPSPELAPHSGLNGGPFACANRYEEVGVQFKLIPLTNADLVAPIGEGANLRRSQLAHACFGTYELAATATTPRQMPAQYGLLDALRNGSKPRLTGCDVPLAVFQFRGGAVDFVDVWPVRRPCLPGVRPDVFPSDSSTGPAELFTSFVSSRRAVEAMAFLLQFQNQLEDIRQDTGLDPPEVAAATYFDYLPAAGYLPLRAASAHTRRFRSETFFGQRLTPTELDPAYLRRAFHDSFYVEPIAVETVVEVDLYTVPGADPAEPYLIFTRRFPVTVSPAAEPAEPEPPETPPEPTARQGDLHVVVLDETGNPAPESLVSAVQATDQATGKVYTASQRSPSKIWGGYQARQYERFVLDERAKTRGKYSPLIDAGREIPFDVGSVLAQRVYTFNDLPVGSYTVVANPPRRSTHYGVSKKVAIKSSAPTYESVTIRESDIRPPGDSCWGGRDSVDLPWGVMVNDFCFDPKWKDLWPWEEEIPDFDPGVIDPPPPDRWLPLDDPFLGLKIEETLGGVPGGPDPRVVMDGAQIYVRRDYDPTTPSDYVDAFVQTGDGSRYPLVMVAADNALDKPAAVTRTAIPDYDGATYDQLGAFGLGNLETAAAAPLGLTAAILGQSKEFAGSLNAETRTTLADDFQNGFMSYPGVTKAMSDALKGEFGDRVGLANATPDEISTALANVTGRDATAWTGFSGRLLGDVRGAVPAESYSLSGAGIGAAGIASLAEVGVTTNRGLVDMAESEEGRATLTQTLGVNEATLNRYVDEAIVNIAAGQFLAAPQRSIATLEGVTPELATELAGQGITGARDLANSDAAGLAARSSFSEAEFEPLITNATSYSYGYSTLIERATGGAVSGETMAGEGFQNVGRMAGAETGALESVPGMTTETATRLHNLSGSFVNRVGGRFVGGF